MYFQAGYDTVNSVHHFSIPGSFSSTATGSNSRFRLTSNVNVPGRWAFRIDHGQRGCNFNGKARTRWWSEIVVSFKVKIDSDHAVS